MQLDQILHILDAAVAVCIYTPDEGAYIGDAYIFYNDPNDVLMLEWTVKELIRCSSLFSYESNKSPLVEEDEDGWMVVHLVDQHGDLYKVTPLIGLPMPS